MMGQLLTYMMGQLEPVEDVAQLMGVVLLQDDKALQSGVDFTGTVLAVDDELLVLFQDKQNVKDLHLKNKSSTM
jgi:hypothetical protein